MMEMLVEIWEVFSQLNQKITDWLSQSIGPFLAFLEKIFIWSVRHLIIFVKWLMTLF